MTIYKYKMRSNQSANRLVYLHKIVITMTIIVAIKSAQLPAAQPVGYPYQHWSPHSFFYSTDTQGFFFVG
jgi:hypothetical protein